MPIEGPSEGTRLPAHDGPKSRMWRSYLGQPTIQGELFPVALVAENAHNSACAVGSAVMKRSFAETANLTDTKTSDTGSLALVIPLESRYQRAVGHLSSLAAYPICVSAEAERIIEDWRCLLTHPDDAIRQIARSEFEQSIEQGNVPVFIGELLTRACLPDNPFVH